jgi:hypothetical protein
VRDFSLATQFRASSPGGVGVVFRYHDPENLSFALLDAERSWRIIARKRGASFGSLSAGGVDAGAGFEVDRLYTLRLVAQGGAIRMLLDGVTVLEAVDDQPDGPGQVGLMTRACDGARFYDLTLLQL